MWLAVPDVEKLNKMAEISQKITCHLIKPLLSSGVIYDRMRNCGIRLCNLYLWSMAMYSKSHALFVSVTGGDNGVEF